MHSTRDALGAVRAAPKRTEKAPAFQFYAADFLVDEKVVLMSNRELGCYIKLICYCWREGSIPADVKRVSKLCGEADSEMSDLWEAISGCFAALPDKAGRLVHPRLELERIRQAEYRRERSAAGKRGADVRWGGERAAKQVGDGVSIEHGFAIEQAMAADASSSASASSTNSVANATGGKPPSPLAVSVKQEIWDAGRSILLASRMPAKQVGSFLGKLVKDYTAPVVLDAVRAAVAEQPADAAEYLKACCMRASGQRRSARADQDAEWQQQLNAIINATEGGDHGTDPDAIDVDAVVIDTH